MGKLLTQEEFELKLRFKRPTILHTGTYVRNNVHSSFHCTVCGHDWVTLPLTLNKSGCPECYFRSMRWTTEQFVDKLRELNPTIELIGEYRKNHSPAKFHCRVCDHEWVVRAGHMINGCGCPECGVKRTGYSIASPASVYLIKIKLSDDTEVIKYGIANNLASRLSKHRRQGMTDIIKIIHFDSGSDARMLESKIRNIFGGNHVSKDKLRDGWTETLPITQTGDVVDFLENYRS